MQQILFLFFFHFKMTLWMVHRAPVHMVHHATATGKACADVEK